MGAASKGTVALATGSNSLPALESKLREAGYEVILTHPKPGGASGRFSPAEIEELFGSVDAIVGVPSIRYTPEMLRASRELRLITSGVIGVDNIDIAAATEMGILVANCPTPENIIGVAEATIMLTVASLLQLKRKEASVRAGAWRPTFSSHILARKTMGLIGYGRIARAVEARLAGWDVKVQAFDPYVPGTIPLDELLGTSDVVSLHVVLTPETRNMIGARELSLMKESAVIVNTSRGGAIDEAALAAALNEGRIAAAAIDVFEREPVNMDNPLFRCDPERVILTPHAIAHNRETGPSASQMALENVERVMRGELPESVINPAVVDTWRERLSNFH